MYIAVTFFGMCNTNGRTAAAFAMFAMLHCFSHYLNMQPQQPQ
jgi:hypothetical protein